MKTSLKISALLLLASVLTGPTASTGVAQQYSRTGFLSCKMAPSLGLIIGSFQQLSCQFKPDQGGPLENYSGTMRRIGLDLGFTAGGVMGWAVMMNAQYPTRGGLTGTYVGGSGDISVGIGVGANALFGGNNNSVALQPLSVEGQIGLNLALGVANLQLRPVY